MNVFQWRHFFCALAISWLCVNPARALELYQGETAVSDQSPEARTAGLARAFMDVAAKVSGDLNALSNPSVIAASAQAERYMQRYEYRQELVRVDGKPTIKLYLIGTFYPSSMKKLLNGVGMGAWGRDRPQIAAYLFEGDLPISSELSRQIQDRAAARGLDIRFPGSIALEDLSENTAARLASPTQNVLLGRVGERIWLSDGQRTEVLSSAAADGLTDRLARMLVARTQAVENAPPQVLSAEITGVRSAADYARAIGQLGKLRAVKKFTVLAASGERMSVELTVQGGIGQLALALNGDKTLALISQTPALLEVLQ